MGTLHIYITPKDITDNYSKYLHYRHYIIDKFMTEHQVKVLDVTKCKYYQNRSNLDGKEVMEIELDERYTEPVDTQKMLKALEESKKKRIGK